jgi:hypothetical protein
MADDLIISGGGSTAVATDDLFGDAADLRAVVREAAEVRQSVSSIDRALADLHRHLAGTPNSVLDATADLERAMSTLSVVRHRADQLSDALLVVADKYGQAEVAEQHYLQELSATGAYLAGVLTSVLWAIAAPILPFAIAIMTPGDPVNARPRGRTTLDSASNQLLTNPVTVALIREAAMSTDDYFGGTLLLPPNVVHALGDDGLGVVGLSTSAALIAGLGSRAGLLTETPVSIKATQSSSQAMAPQGFAERISRIPDSLESSDHAQIVVEKYSEVGAPDRFQVYIGGTVDFSPRAGDDAFDMTSNIAGIAGLPAGSYVAVQKALAESGVTADTPIVFTGYSQGGLVASLLASSGEYNTQGIVTIGAPAGQVELPHDIPAVIIEHTDDLVPALGGTQSNHDAVLVQRQAFAGREVPTDEMVPAHHLEYYLVTAHELDQARSDQVTTAAEQLDAFGHGATTITSTRYVATRDSN